MIFTQAQKPQEQINTGTVSNQQLGTGTDGASVPSTTIVASADDGKGNVVSTVGDGQANDAGSLTVVDGGKEQSVSGNGQVQGNSTTGSGGAATDKVSGIGGNKGDPVDSLNGNSDNGGLGSGVGPDDTLTTKVETPDVTSELPNPTVANLKTNQQLPEGYRKNSDGSITGIGGGRATDTGLASIDGKVIYQRDSGGYYTIGEKGTQTPFAAMQHPTLKEAKLFHDKRQADAASHFNSQPNINSVSEVTIKNADGVVARTDIVVQGKRNGSLDIPEGFTATDIHGNPVTKIPLDDNGRAMVEIKTGNANLTTNQKACYGDACGIGGVKASGKNADKVKINGKDAPEIVIILRDKSKEP